jgi:hypothetical protein
MQYGSEVAQAEKVENSQESIPGGQTKKDAMGKISGGIKGYSGTKMHRTLGPIAQNVGEIVELE